ncbi:hypothetical protein EV360DRAFT_65933 [Lentinula raphanica]|nr:hypothetical protein EV360DRAFT_65933 [Lentinula raphanica]
MSALAGNVMITIIIDDLTKRSVKEKQKEGERRRKDVQQKMHDVLQLLVMTRKETVVVSGSDSGKWMFHLKLLDWRGRRIVIPPLEYEFLDHITVRFRRSSSLERRLVYSYPPTLMVPVAVGLNVSGLGVGLDVGSGVDWAIGAISYPPDFHDTIAAFVGTPHFLHRSPPKGDLYLLIVFDWFVERVLKLDGRVLYTWLPILQYMLYAFTQAERYIYARTSLMTKFTQYSCLEGWFWCFESISLINRYTHNRHDTQNDGKQTGIETHQCLKAKFVQLETGSPMKIPLTRSTVQKSKNMENQKRERLAFKFLIEQ